MRRENKIFDLKERTTVFSEQVIKFIKKLEVTIYNKNIIIQLLKSVTSIAANYMEADETITRKDLIYKISLCIKETKESKYWLRILNTTFNNPLQEIEYFYQEAHELNLFFSKIIRNNIH